MVDLKGSKIIQSEFGNLPVGRGTMDKMNWWPQLLQRVNDICESSYNHGKEDGVAEAEKRALGDNQVIISKNEHARLLEIADAYRRDEVARVMEIPEENGKVCYHAKVCKFYEER